MAGSAQRKSNNRRKRPKAASSRLEQLSASWHSLSAQLQRPNRNATPRKKASFPAWLLPLGLVVFAALFVPVNVMDDAGLPRYRSLKAELGALEAHNEALRLKVRKAKTEVAALRNNPAAIERVARQELGMVRPNELVLYVTP